MQVLLGAMLINTLHAAFEDAEIAFDCIRISRAAPIFVLAMVNRLMLRKALAELLIDVGFVSV